ncbi:MAG: hypothetical protein NVSMB44_33280 [Ktedonobacteraceae bacterium]
MRIPFSVSGRSAAAIRHGLLALWVVLFFLTTGISGLREPLPSSLTTLVIVLWAALPACLLIAWAFQSSSAGITWLQFALTLLLATVVAPLLTLLIEQYVSIWIDQRFSPAQTLFGLPYSTLLFYCLCTPVIEEACKAFGPLVLWRRQQTVKAALLLGCVSGCGFAFSETCLYLFGQENWASLAISRLGVVVVHAVASGFVACGFSFLRMNTSARRILGGGIIATGIAIHAVFNCMNILLTPLNLDQTSIISGIPLTAILFINVGFASFLLVALVLLLSSNLG